MKDALAMVFDIWARWKDRLLDAAAAVLGSALVSIIAVLWIQLHGLPFIGGGVLADLADARTALKVIDAAQPVATAAQIAVNQEPARRSAIIAGVSNEQAPEYLDRVRRAAGGRLRPEPACAASPADLPRADRAIKSADDAPEAADMVSVARSDWTDLVVAGGQAALCARDGRALIEAGLAVEAEQ